MSFVLSAALGVFLCPSSRAADLPHPKMDLALDLLTQTQAITDTSSDIAQAQDTALLTEALKLLTDEPDNETYHGHRSQAIDQVAIAINALKANKSSGEIHKAIGQAVTEIHAATGIPENSPAVSKGLVVAPRIAPPPDSNLPPDPGYLKNADLKDGLTYWHGSVEIAFLKADGTEGAEGDADVIPVIKMALSHARSHEVYQEFKTPDNPGKINLEVSVFASSDFKRSTFKSDYTMPWQNESQMYWWCVVVPNSDFWIRSNSGDYSYMYTLQNLQPGAWTTVKSRWVLYSEGENRMIDFCTPPGEGTIYLKNPSAKP